MSGKDIVPESWAHFISYVRGGRPFGRDGHIRVTYFLDLLSAAHSDRELDVMAELLSSRISHQEKPESYSAVACPKRGNVLLLKEVGRKLAKRTLCVRDSILFQNWAEGDARLGERVVLLDDIASDGAMLRDAILNLRKIGVYADAVYALVDRVEGDAGKLLSAEGVKYDSIFQMSDSDLANIKGAGRA